MRDASSSLNRESLRSPYCLRFRTFSGSIRITSSSREKGRSWRSASISLNAAWWAMCSRSPLPCSTLAVNGANQFLDLADGRTRLPGQFRPHAVCLVPTGLAEKSDEWNLKAIIFAPGSRPRDTASCFIGRICDWVSDLFMRDLVRGVAGETQLTFDPSSEGPGIWLPDGRTVNLIATELFRLAALRLWEFASVRV